MKTFLFYFISFTWGIIMSVIGSLTTLILLILGNKPKRYRCAWYFTIGESWGGINLGPCFIVGSCNTSVIPHEYGHGMQNCILGPLFPFIIALPSLIRAGYRIAFFSAKSSGLDALIVFIVTYTMFILVSCMFNMYMWWMWILFGIGLYITILSLWIVYIEGARYTELKYPTYDDAWFEGWATRIGNYLVK